MATAARQYLLKILSGTNQGAEAPVGGGDLTLGSADTADIILGDARVAPQQLQLSFAGDKVTLIALAPGVYVQGKPIKPKAAPTPVQDYQFITIGGGTHIVLGPATGAWPQISAADAPPLQKEAPKAAPAVEGAADKEKARDKPAGAAASAEKEPKAAAAAAAAETDKAKAPETEKPAAASDKAKDKEKAKTEAKPAAATDSAAANIAAAKARADAAKKPAGDAKPARPPYYTAIIGCLLIVFACVIAFCLLWPGQREISMAPLTSEQLKQRLEGRIKELNLSSILRVEISDPPPRPTMPGQTNSADALADARAASGQVRVVGYVATDEERRKVANALAPSMGNARMEIFSQENLLAQASEILRGLGIRANLAMDGPGVMVASGYVVSRDAWNRAVTFMRSDIRGLRDLKQTGIVAAPELITEIRTLLTEARLDNDVRVDASVQQLTAVGTITQARVPAWQEVRKKIEERTGGLVRLVDQVQVRSPVTQGGSRKDPLDLEIQGVSAIPPFLTLRNGQSYFPGAVLPNGYTLVTIHAGQLILQKESERISLNLEDMTWQQQNP